MKSFLKWTLAVAVITGVFASMHGTSWAQVVTDYYGGTTNTNTEWLCNVLGAVTPGYPCVDPSSGISHQADALSWLKSACAWNDSNCLKQNFINAMWGALNEGGGTNNYELNHVGANYIVDTMIAQNNNRTIYPDARGNAAAYAEWVKRMNNPQVTATIWYSYTFHINTAFDPNNSDIAQYADTETADIIMFYVSGAPTYAVKLDCGNPVGNLTPLPKIPPTTLSCGSMISPNNAPEIGSTFDVVATMTFSGGTNPPSGISGDYMKINGVPVSETYALTGSYGTGYTITLTAANQSFASPGNYTVSWGAAVNELGVKDCGAPSDVNANFDVLAHPFFGEVGGDVNAGTGFAAPNPGGNNTQPCPAPTNNNAGITSWNDGAPAYSGAGGQYGVFALNQIQGFVSNKGNGPPTSLSFSNKNGAGGHGTTVDVPSSLFGGYFGKPPCVDYWYTKPSSFSPWPVGGSNINISSFNSSGSYMHNGNLTIVPGSNTLHYGLRVTMYVNGDLTIKGDVDYGTDGPGGTWTSEAKIPNLRVVVHGRIFIDSSVSNLDGTYVAIPNQGYDTATDHYANPNNGTIVTCSNNANPPDPTTAAGSSWMMSQCQTLLTINGGLIANHIYMLRTHGSASNGQPAEVVNNSPEVWLAPLTGGSVDSRYQSIAGLPPVL